MFINYYVSREKGQEVSKALQYDLEISLEEIYRMRQECKDICSQMAYIVYNTKQTKNPTTALRKNTKA